jgi:Phage terminase large subunit
MEINAEFPEKLQFLFKPSRYKVAHGGRGGAKSWGFARALLIQAASTPLRIMCAREFQNSIQESVHRLLAEQIHDLGLNDHYEVLQSVIRGKNGSEFVFAGLRTDPNKIKSAEGFDRCWVEEAEKVSAESWKILIPTIRKHGSEIWVSLNPHLMTDATYQQFVVNPPPDAVVVQVNWRDNPWFPEVLDKERRHMQETDPEAYRHVWEGHCLEVGDNQLIGMEEAYRAADRHYSVADYDFAPKVMGVDVARYGGDRSTIFKRQGLVAFPPTVFNGVSNMDLASAVAATINDWKPDGVFVDAGRGEGVIDRLIQLGYSPVEVNFGGKPIDSKYANKRAEMWDTMAKWIKTNGAIPNMPDLIADLSAPTYLFSNSTNKFALESKETMKARGCKSPDIGDALALTFAHPVAVKEVFHQRPNNDYNPLDALKRSSDRMITEYNPFAENR